MLEGDYLFETFCAKRGYPKTIQELSELEEDLAPGEEHDLDAKWEMICLQFEAHNQGKIIIADITDTMICRDMETELKRHDIPFSWDEGLLYVPEDRKSLVYSILDGIRNRGVILPGSFGVHQKRL